MSNGLLDQDESAPQPGRFGRFYLQELLNRGGVAEVWGGVDPEGRHFALRRMINNSLLNWTERKRFFHGCEVLSKIHHHEHIVNYIEHGKIDGTPYLLMDFITGKNLKLRMGDPGGDEVLTQNVAQIVLDMASALEEVHDSGYIHLDFKPENIMVTPNANVRLVDFDLAQPKPEEPRRFSGPNAGTPAYMAPEHLRHDPIDQRADIFAFGVTAYEVLTNAKPFPGATPDDILSQQVSGDIAAPRSINGDIPAALEKIILKCLQSDPEERYPYMSVVTRDLQTILYV